MSVPFVIISLIRSVERMGDVKPYTRRQDVKSSQQSIGMFD